jgi:hypothetical protein
MAGRIVGKKLYINISTFVPQPRIVYLYGHNPTSGVGLILYRRVERSGSAKPWQPDRLRGTKVPIPATPRVWSYKVKEHQQHCLAIFFD